MPAEKSVHITLKMNAPTDLCERAAKGETGGHWGLLSYAEAAMGGLIEAWKRDGSPYGPPDIPKAPPIPMPSPVHAKTVPAVSATNYEECLSCQ